MATDVTSMPINGNYAPHQGYGGLEQQQNSFAYGANNSAAAQARSVQPPASSTTPAATSSTQQSDVPKDQVGWYFVEQYYTTLSRSPDKLYLFYNKRSQFVSGQETDKVAVCLGQRAINDRIKELDFQDCKVRVTNVDSQASDSNIVIQVIGEISNKSQPHKKFTQTFVLATQTNGYFVLNDIFRYLVDEEDEPEPEAEPVMEEVQQAAPAAESGYQEPAPRAAEVEPKTLTSSIDPIAVENDAMQVDKELEQKVLKDQPPAEEEPEPTVNGISETEPETKQAEDAPAAVVDAPEEPSAPSAPSAPSTTGATRGTTEEEEDLKTEQPKAPEQTPAGSPPKQATPQPLPAPASKPAAPKTWASLAASANRVATPSTPSPASSASSQPKPATTTKPAVTTASTAPSAPSAPAAQSAPTAPAAQRDDSPTTGDQGDEWTAVGSSHNRQQSRQTNQQDGPQNRGYIKNVYDSIDGNELRSKLEEFGELSYFDISRQKVR